MYHTWRTWQRPIVRNWMRFLPVVRNMYVLLRVRVVSNLNHNSIRVSVVDSRIISWMDVIKRFSLSTLLSRWVKRWEPWKRSGATIWQLPDLNPLTMETVFVISTNRDVYRASASTGWTATNYTHRKCLASSLVPHCIVISTKNLNECFPVSLPKGKSQCECCLPTIIPVSLWHWLTKMIIESQSPFHVKKSRPGLRRRTTWKRNCPNWGIRLSKQKK